MLISVIVIGYNIGKYINQCLNSIINQTYRNIEIIFVDDGSKDNTKNVAEKYISDSRIKIICKQNGGIVSARKEGVRDASGDYVCFIDGDDWINDDMIENLIKGINQLNYLPDIVCSPMYKQRSQGNFEIFGNSADDNFADGKRFFELIMSDQANHHMFPKLYRREFVLSAGYLDYPEVTMGEDLMTNALFGLHNPKVIFLNTPNYYYRYNESSAIHKSDNTLLQQVKTLQYMEERICTDRSTKLQRDLMQYQWASYAYNYANSLIKSSFKKEIVEAVKTKITGIENSPYYKLLLKNHSKLSNIRYISYIKAPKLTPLLDPIASKVYYGAKDAYWEYNKRKYLREKKTLIPYYKSLTEKIAKKYNSSSALLMATSDRSNIGDHAIAYSEKKLIEKWLPERCVIEITGDHYRCDRTGIRKLIKPTVPIFISGGGFLGDLWMDEENLVRKIITDFPNNPIIVLPQTMFFVDYSGEKNEYLKSKKIYLSHKNIRFFFRDEKSYNLGRQMLGEDKVHLFPDMALFTELKWHYLGQDNTGYICFRTDKESVIPSKLRNIISDRLKSNGLEIKNVSTLSSGKAKGDIKLSEREEKIRAKIEEFSKARIIITDRLHGMILSALAGTPCIAFDNSSRKVRGVYEAWLKNLNYISVLTLDDDVEKEINRLISLGHQDYSHSFLDVQLKLMKDDILGFLEKNEYGKESKNA